MEYIKRLHKLQLAGLIPLSLFNDYFVPIDENYKHLYIGTTAHKPQDFSCGYFELAEKDTNVSILIASKRYPGHNFKSIFLKIKISSSFAGEIFSTKWKKGIPREKTELGFVPWTFERR